MELLKNKQIIECANAIKQGNNHYRYEGRSYKITDMAKKYINLYQYGVIIPCLIVLLTKDINIYNYTVSTIIRLAVAIIIYFIYLNIIIALFNKDASNNVKK